MIAVEQSLKGTQIDQAAQLLVRFSREEAFWDFFASWISGINLSEHDILEEDHDIFLHIKLMFTFNLNIEIVSYRTKNPFSSTLGHAKGNRVYENKWKMDAMTLSERVGHLGHEVCHLLGYHHEYQGQKTSAAVVFGNAMEAYAERRIKNSTSALS
jgi:hypothetical protein